MTGPGAGRVGGALYYSGDRAEQSSRVVGQASVEQSTAAGIEHCGKVASYPACLRALYTLT